MKSIKTTIGIAVLALAAAITGCSGELTNDGAPVELIVTNSQNLQVFDFSPNDDADCNQEISTISALALPKSDLTGDALQVRLSRYRVSYQRTDGGTSVPASFVRSIDQVIVPGAVEEVGGILLIQPDALSQAPFAALRNGGRDPVTGRTFVKMDVIVELFGETLGGDRVYDATRFSLDFCFECVDGCE